MGFLNTKYKRWPFLLMVWLTGLALVSSCGYYSFKGALPSHLKTVAVPLFYSQAQEPEVAEELTNAVIDKFIADNTLKVTDEDQADMIITGTILPIPPPKPAIVKSGEQVAEMLIKVTAKVKCEDVRLNKVRFNSSFSQEISLDATAGLEERQQAIKEALDIIAEDIVNTTLSGW